MTITPTLAVKAPSGVTNPAGSLAPVLDATIDGGTITLLDYTNGTDCMNAIADGVIPNGAVAHSLKSGAPNATFTDNGTNHFSRVAGAQGILALGGVTTSYLDLGSVAVLDRSVNPSHGWLFTHSFKIPLTGWTTAAASMIGLRLPATAGNTEQFGIGTASSGLAVSAPALTGLAADGVDFTGSISDGAGGAGTILNVAAIAAGAALAVGQTLSAVSGVTFTTCTITGQTSGPTGGIGNYTVSVSQLVVSTRLFANARSIQLNQPLNTATSTVISGTGMIISGVVTGSFLPSQVLSGTGVITNTKIVSQTSGPAGGAGVYVIDTNHATPTGSITVTAYPLIPGQITYAMVAWTPGRAELWIATGVQGGTGINAPTAPVLVAFSTNAAFVPFLMKSMAGGGARLWDFQSGTHYRTTIRDLTLSGVSSTVGALAEFNVFSQLLPDRGITS